MSRTDLIKVQRRSFDWFKGDGLSALFGDIFPIEDCSGSYKVAHLEHRLGKPHVSIRKAKESGRHYDAPLFLTMLMTNAFAAYGMQQPVFLCDIPLMTGKGTFVYYGKQVIVADQLVPVPGIYFSSENDEDGDVVTCSAQIIPARGAWLEFDIDEWDTLGVRFDRGKRVPVETLLRALGCDQRELSNMFRGTPFYDLTLEEDHFRISDESLFDAFKRMRAGELAAVPDRRCFERLFNNKGLYDLSVAGRERLNEKLGLATAPGETVLSKDDILECINYLVCLNSNLPGYAVDHQLEQLDSYVVRTAGELLLERIRVGLWRMQQQLLASMATEDWGSITPQGLTNTRPLETAVRDLFEFGKVIDEIGGLTVFMDQSEEVPQCTIPHGTCKDGSALCVGHMNSPEEVNSN